MIKFVLRAQGGVSLPIRRTVSLCTLCDQIEGISNKIADDMSRINASQWWNFLQGKFIFGAWRPHNANSKV